MLTLFLVWPVLLACVMVSLYWTNLLAVVAYLAIILITCLTTAMLALFCSVLFKKTASALMTTYLVIMVLFCAPLAANYFAETFFRDHPAAPYIEDIGLTSPFAAAFAVPLDVGVTESTSAAAGEALGSWPLFAAYVAFSLGLNGGLLVAMIWLFNTRWRVAG